MSVILGTILLKIIFIFEVYLNILLYVLWCSQKNIVILDFSHITQPY